MSIEYRFNTFVRSIEGAEFIDDLDLTSEQQKSKRADFLFESRKIICEMKSLTKDMGSKVSRVLEELHHQAEQTILYDEDELHGFLKYLPHIDSIDKKTVYGVMSSVDDCVESANRQIRSTKKAFDLEESVGVLVILNDSVDVLSPPLVGRWLQDSFCKRTSDGQVRFPYITAAMFISECHYTTDLSERQSPIFIIGNDFALNYQYGCDFLKCLLQKWATYNDVSLQMSDKKYPENVNCKSLIERRIIIF